MSMRELVDELLAGRSHVTRDEHAIRIHEFGEADSEGVRDLSVELVGHRTPDVVRLDDFIQC